MALTSGDVLWGQSLHFGLDKRQTKYLNVMVYAKPKENNNPIGDIFPVNAKETSDEEQKTILNTTPILLGHVNFIILL